MVLYLKERCPNIFKNNILWEITNMTICPIALAVGCEKCPAFKFCPLTTVLGDLEEKDEIDPSNKIWKENFTTADEYLDKMDDLEKNKKEDAGKQWPLHAIIVDVKGLWERHFTIKFFTNFSEFSGTN
jgi:hypothetical protein